MKQIIENASIKYCPTINENIVYLFFKRLFDICASFFALAVLSVLMLLIALAIVLTSKGHAMYVDKRAGKGGKTIGVLKFRTMYSDANTNPQKYLSQEQMQEFETERKVKKDPRVTKVGKVLRKTSLDELPQLFNIFIGQMSVIGPRAVTMEEITNNYTKEQAQVLLKARPGLSGGWGVYGRYSATYANGRRQLLELDYLANRSFFGDVKLIFLTVIGVLTRKEINKKQK